GIDRRFDRPLGNDVLVLCASDSLSKDALRSGRFDGEEIVGIEWGIGSLDHALRYLGSGNWTVARVPGTVAVPVPDPFRYGNLVKFTQGEILYDGEPSQAVRILVGAGVDPAKLVADVSTAGRSEIARVGQFGVVRAGRRGWAIAGPKGDAEAD